MTFSTNTVNSSNPPNPQKSILKERAAAKFSPEEMNYFLEGSKERAEIIKMLVQQMERDPVLSVSSKYYDLNKDQQRALAALKIDRMSRYIENDSTSVFNKRLSLMGVFDPQVSTRIGINLGLFLGCIRSNGTVKQFRYWASHKEASSIKHIYGCFGMTELAHGSNVSGLETTATFDKETDEFIIHTPHIGATKWWIGGAAHSSTHCAVYARLIVNGNDYGVKTFIVPLRDSNHDLCPGVSVGDIGAKMGRDGIDNGWIQFSNVRIPRLFMLQKFCKVSKNGEVLLPQFEQLSYYALLGGRVVMVFDSYRIIARMITIALRYAVCRRQFKSNAGDYLEKQILDYTLHQRRLLPFLALGYVISSGALKLEETIENTLNYLDENVENDNMASIYTSVDAIKSLFIDSGSLKSTCTWLAAEVIDQCRQACGGHGYSSYNGFGKAYNDWVVQCTWEGDNNVLATSISRPLMKLIVSSVRENKPIEGPYAFLNNAKEYLMQKEVLKTVDDLKDLNKILYAIEVAIIRISYHSSTTVQENDNNIDIVGSDMVTVSKLKAHHYLLREFLIRIDFLENRELTPYLIDLGRLYSASIILERFSGVLLAHSIFSKKLAITLNYKHIPYLCKKIRPHVIPLTDSFQQSDMMINAAIGNFDGDIYENYFNIVKANNPPSNTKAPYSALLESMLNRPRKDIRERFEKSTNTASILLE